MTHRHLRSHRSASTLAVSTLALLAALAWAAAATSGQPQPDLEQQLAGTVRPFLRSYCSACHSGATPQAQLDLTAYTSLAAVMRDDAHWSRVLEKLAAKQMPPPSAGKQPSDKQREAIIAWIRAVRQVEAERDAGDPGPVPARRLSNAEYDDTIRDLTGVDMQPAREFPVDPANQEGFDNSGESLTLSPALLKKYAEAAKGIADHAVLTSRGLEFATHPVVVETDRDKFCVLRIVDFYKRQPTDLADYFEAAWRCRYRSALGAPGATRASLAAAAKVSPRYLELVWNTLTAPGEKIGPMAKLQAMWNALPAAPKAQPEAARAGCVAMRDWVLALRKKLAWHFDDLRLPRGFARGGQVFVLWKDRQYASHRRSFDPENLQVGGVPRTRVVPSRRRRAGMPPAQTVTDPVDPDLFVPKEAAARAPYLASFTRFCSVFPDAFYISERGLMFDDYTVDQHRLLSAGLHNSMGYFRDDTPLMELVLDESGRRELDSLWKDFDMVAFIPERMHREFFHYERAESGTITSPEFNFARAEDPDATSDAQIRRLGDLYLAKARKNMHESGGDPVALQAIQEHFQRVSANIRAAERARVAAEPLHLKSLLDFAQRAYRRPLTESERADLLAFYHSLRQKEGLSHEDALRDTLASILLSPNFLFRLDLADEGDTGDDRRQATDDSRAKAGGAHHASYLSPVAPRPSPVDRRLSSSIQPLSDYALASRLSYFLWSSMPDAELLAHAAAGDLHRPEVLAAQARRMLRDPRVRDLALEFGGQWLDFRRFEEHNAVDRNRFPSFDDNLREAMFQEPVRFLTDEFQHNRSVLEMLYGKYTFVNAALARHYGMTGVKVDGDEWARVENADRYGRGGLLPMAAFLTRNSPGLRTSPVKRGFWVVHRLLGETIPPPPPTVPQLPQDESKLGDRTLRQALAEHRSNPACAGCHARFDSYGLVFEGYGPIGEARDKDLGGKPVDASAPFPGGERTGVAGLQAFIRQQRQSDFLSNLCRKLLSYALGRSLQPSDDPMLLRIQQRLAAGGYRFDSLVDTIVTSPQFRCRRASVTIARR
jgi:mono/diheme cytochrome c family protein